VIHVADDVPRVVVENLVDTKWLKPPRPAIGSIAAMVAALV
jgi:hypothetical protein